MRSCSRSRPRRTWARLEYVTEYVRGCPRRETRLCACRASPAPSAADRIDAATPASRDRYVDFLRVFSLGTVIVGHWLMAVVVVGREGNVTTTNALALMPALQPLTWVLQVMPVFFLVGGYANARAWESLRRRGGTYADFVRTRAGRLLRRRLRSPAPGCS